ncbi:ribonuclease H-like domain-containing protein [Xylaria nigripes]|nr:ribonuclease H-like domain-containing protein [Xylaria nigripes]
MAGGDHQKNHVREQEHQHGSSESNPDDTTQTSLTHFCPYYWRDGSESDTVLQNRPDCEYPWASPALSETVHSLLALELLDDHRLRSEGFPLLPPLFKYGRVIRFADSRTARSPPESDPNSRTRKYAALVIDCEMVELVDHVSDLVRISVVDFITGDVLLNTLVKPVGAVKQWRTRVSGVHPGMLRAAKADPNTTVLKGWPEAREKIFALADENTIFIGHALSNDLKVLRIASERVVDSLVLTAQAAFGSSIKRFPRMWSLKSACKELMNIDIQRGRAAHDPLEDALAARELIIWCLTHSAALLAWGYDGRTAFEEITTVRRAKQLVEARKKAQEAACKRAEEAAREKAEQAERLEADEALQREDQARQNAEEEHRKAEEARHMEEEARKKTKAATDGKKKSLAILPGRVSGGDQKTAPAPKGANSAAPVFKKTRRRRSKGSKEAPGQQQTSPSHSSR